MPNTLVVLAAGIGSRYGGLKQMDPIGPSGEFILDYSVYDALQADFSKVVFVIRKDIENDFRSVVGRRIEARVETRYLIQELTDVPSGFEVPNERAKPWGTGHAVLTCRDAVDEPFGVINSDDFYGRESYAVLSDFLTKTQEQPSAYAMVGFVLRNTLSDHGTVARGICRSDPEGNLQDVVEHTKVERVDDEARSMRADGSWEALSGESVTSMNYWGFKPSVFDHLSRKFGMFLEERGTDPKAEYFMPTVVNELIREEAATVRVLRSNSRWFGVTYPEDKQAVMQRIRELIDVGEYPEDLWAGTRRP